MEKEKFKKLMEEAREEAEKRFAEDESLDPMDLYNRFLRMKKKGWNESLEFINQLNELKSK